MLAFNYYQDYGSERALDIDNRSKPNSRVGDWGSLSVKHILYFICNILFSYVPT